MKVEDFSVHRQVNRETVKFKESLFHENLTCAKLIGWCGLHDLDLDNPVTRNHEFLKHILASVEHSVVDNARLCAPKAGSGEHPRVNKRPAGSKDVLVRSLRV